MNINAQGCGIIVMLVILYFFVSQKKLKLRTSKAFISIWSAVMIALVFDILSLIAIENRHVLPISCVHAICKIYLWTVTWEAMAAVWYVCVDIFKSNDAERKWRNRTWCNAVITNILIAVLPIHIYDRESSTYTFGAAVIVTYVIALMHLFAVAILTTKHKNQMNPRRRNSVLTWIIIWITAASIQFIDNSVLIVGFAGSIGILIIYLMLENPIINMDRDTGLFNLNALFEYVKELQGRMKDVSIVCVRYDNNRNTIFSFEIENSIAREVVDFISDTENAITFRSSASEFILVFDNEEMAKHGIDKISKRFEQPWGKENLRMLPIDIYFLESTENIRRSTDVLSIFQYAKQNRAEMSGSDVVTIGRGVVDRIYDEMSIENEIIDALSEDRIEVFYQPIYCTRKRNFTTAEALVRIRSRDGEIIPPGRFIGIAEKRGLIIRLGERVFEKVCQFIVNNDLRELGLEYIEINLSVIQCAYENLAKDFITIMNWYNINPKDIVLEITESASVLEKQILLQNMNELRKMGVRFALDDFGTGQSNLNYIVDMPIDIVKFDSGMTSAYFENGKGKPVMDAAMGMIQKLELEIVSEGIEEQEQFKKLDELGIDYIQGYYFSRPKKDSEFVRFIKDNNLIHE